MFKNWTERRKLQAEIAKIEAAYAPSLRKLKGEEAQIEYAEMRGETQWAEITLQELESEAVERKAEKWGITIDLSLFETNMADHLVLDKANRTKVLRLVRAARRENVKWWVGIIAPILGALTGVIGSAIGILAFLHRR
jgi:hypothetical protein